MGVRIIKPRTPGQRFQIVNDFSELTKRKPEKSLLYSVKKISGRNNQGRITVRHRGGGHKRRGRMLELKTTKENIPGIVKSIEYDPMRTGRIMLIAYKDGEKNVSYCTKRHSERRRNYFWRKGCSKNRKHHAAKAHANWFYHS